jgi:hypothetical protein
MLVATKVDDLIMPAHYEIRINCHISSQCAAEWFDGLTISNLPNGQAALCGPICDQSVLFGVLEKIRDLNLGLIAVNRMEEWPAT